MDVNDLFWGYEKKASHSAFSVSAEMDKRPWLSSSFSTSLAKDFKSKRSSAPYSLWTRSAQLADRRDQIRPLHCLKHSVFCTVVLPFTGVFINSKTFSSFVIGVLLRQNAMMSLPCDFKKIILFKFPLKSVMIACCKPLGYSCLRVDSNISATISNLYTNFSNFKPAKTGSGKIFWTGQDVVTCVHTMYILFQLIKAT